MDEEKLAREQAIADNLKEVMQANGQELKNRELGNKSFGFINPAPMARTAIWWNMMRNGDKASPLLEQVGNQYENAKEALDSAVEKQTPIDASSLYKYPTAEKYVSPREQSNIWNKIRGEK